MSLVRFRCFARNRPVALFLVSFFPVLFFSGWRRSVAIVECRLVYLNPRRGCAAAFSWFRAIGPPRIFGLGIYVSPVGDDSNPGTMQTPWRTIQHAADKRLPPAAR